MKILHVLLTRMAIPPLKYGGTERVLWGLHEGQKALGHKVRILAKENPSKADNILIYDSNKPIEQQVEGWADIIHFHWPFEGELETPFVCTEHSNCEEKKTFPINTIYLSKKHAENNTATCYVHNGLYWPSYGEPNLSSPKDYFHFLAKASWRVKNLQDTVTIAKRTKNNLHVLGGKRINFKRNPYCYLSPSLRFHGMVGGNQKHELIKNSKGLIFPVLWHEPFGLAVTESLYLGCPVFATPYGSLPDIISREDIGFLSNNLSELAESITKLPRFSRKACHYHAKQHFDHITMSKRYISCYEKVLGGETLNRQNPRSKENIKSKLKMFP